jgi:hypothetical protein
MFTFVLRYTHKKINIEILNGVVDGEWEEK